MPAQPEWLQGAFSAGSQREMPLLIDGHNLIAQVASLRLSDQDDEHQLVELVRGFCARVATKATVYFDKGNPASLDPLPAGGVSVRFVREPRTADQAIVRHLARLGGDAKNWTVVSSDREVQRAAARSGARTVTSQAFARALLDRPGTAGPDKPGEAPSEDEIAYWEKRFRDSPPEP
jgi:predicted RNA-binding protein with PIN domain